MKGNDSFYEMNQSTEYKSFYAFSTIRNPTTESTLGKLESSPQDLPGALLLLDKSLQQSNANVADLKENLSYVMNRERSLQTDYDTLVTTHKKSRKKYKESIMSLKNQEGALQVQLEQQREKYTEKMQNQSQSHEESITILQETIQSLSEQLEAQRQAIETHLATQKQVEARASAQEAEISGFNRKWLIEHQRNLSLCDEVESLKAKLEQAIVQGTETDHQLSEVSDQLKCKTSQIQTLEEQLVLHNATSITLESDFSQISNEYKKYKNNAESNITEITNTVKTWMLNLEQKTEELSKIKNEWTLRNNENSELKIINAQLVAENENLNKNLEKIGEDIEYISSKQEQDAREKAELTDQLEKMAYTLEIANSDNDTLQQGQELKMKEHISEIESQSVEIQSLQVQLASLKASSGEKELRLEGELGNLRKQFNDLGKQHMTASDELSRVQEKMHTAQNKFKKSDLQQSLLAEKYEAAFSDIQQEHADKLHKIQLEKSRLELEVKRLRNEAAGPASGSGCEEDWKWAVLEIAWTDSEDRSSIEALLGITEEHTPAEGIEKLVYGIKEILSNSRLRTPSLRSSLSLDLATCTERKSWSPGNRQLIRSFVRICPLDPKFKQSAGIHINQNQLCVSNTAFYFDRIYEPTDSQELVIQDIYKIAASVADGISGCIIALGATGTGKTYTMEGSANSLGINYKAIQVLFDIIKNHKNEEDFTIGLSIIEVYNERITNLLIPSENEANQSTQIVYTYQDVVESINLAKINRSFSCDNIFTHSAHSHHIISLQVMQMSKRGVMTSELCMVELAGNEEVSQRSAEGQRLMEACSIGQTYTALNSILSATLSGSTQAAYSDSKLTTLLQSVVNPDCQIALIAHISSAALNIKDTMNTLNYLSGVTSAVNVYKSGRYSRVRSGSIVSQGTRKAN